jgi:hypothetical protein
MCGGGRYCSGQDTSHLCSGMQQTCLTVSASNNPRANSLGHRSVPYLQGCEFIFCYVCITPASALVQTFLSTEFIQPQKKLIEPQTKLKVACLVSFLSYLM